MSQKLFYSWGKNKVMRSVALSEHEDIQTKGHNL